MFRIEAFCDDKNLPRVLHALAGLVHGQPAIQPVANAKVKNGVIRAKSSGDIVEMFAEHLKTNKISIVIPADIRAFAVKHGYAEKSYSFFLSKLIQAKLLKRKPGMKSHKSAYAVVN